MANSKVQEEFLANPEGKRDRKQEAATRKSNLGRKKPLKPVSEDREKELKRWALIKQSMIEAQIKTNGYTSCMECGLVNPKPMDLDHIIPTSKNGIWFPSNAQLLCRVCHDFKHQNQPIWSGSDSRD